MTKIISFLFIILYTNLSFGESKDKLDSVALVKPILPDQITLSSCDNSKNIERRQPNMLKSH